MWSEYHDDQIPGFEFVFLKGEMIKQGQTFDLFVEPHPPGRIGRLDVDVHIHRVAYKESGTNAEFRLLQMKAGDAATLQLEMKLTRLTDVAQPDLWRDSEPLPDSPQSYGWPGQWPESDDEGMHVWGLRR